MEFWGKDEGGFRRGVEQPSCAQGADSPHSRACGAMFKPSFRLDLPFHSLRYGIDVVLRFGWVGGCGDASGTVATQ